MNIVEYSKVIDDVIKEGKYKDNLASLANHKAPDWFTNGKFGIFIHWGVFSVPAYGNEWYPRAMYDKNHREFNHHIETYGSHKNFGYKDFIPMFKAEKFDANAWIDLFVKSGAKYVMPVAEHHDGYAMYDTEFNQYNAKKTGPKVDVLGEIKKACESRGLVFTASSHRAEHFFFMNMGRTFDSDVNDEKYQDFYGPAFYCKEFDSDCIHKTTADAESMPPTKEYMEDWLVRTCEIVDKYQPKIVYFDWWIHNKGFKPYLKKFAAYYYNRAVEWGQEVTINYKHEAFAPTVGTFDVERGALTGISPTPWQTDTAVAKNSWCYTEENCYKTTYQIICDLIDIVSKNGNLLLNIGPKSDGTISEEETKILLEIGHWLSINGEGIYGTTYWQTFGEGSTNTQEGFFKDNDEKPFTNEDFRFTYKQGVIYAFQMKPIKQGSVLIKTFAQTNRSFIIKSVEALGDSVIDSYERNSQGLIINLSSENKSVLPTCFKITLE